MEFTLSIQAIALWLLATITLVSIIVFSIVFFPTRRYAKIRLEKITFNIQKETQEGMNEWQKSVATLIKEFLCQTSKGEDFHDWCYKKLDECSVDQLVGENKDKALRFILDIDPIMNIQLHNRSRAKELEERIAKGEKFSFK